MYVQVSLMIDRSAIPSLQQIEEQIIEAGREGLRLALKQGLRAWEEQHRRYLQ